MGLDERKRIILKTVINAYIRTGEPVGSKALAGLEDLKVSSATIRNEMSELEKLGYLTKPHTSAGRIPSSEGYRYYVSNALHSYRLTEGDIKKLTVDPASAGLKDTVKDSAEKLAEFSNCVVFAVSPVCTGGVYSFEMMPVGRQTVAVVAISSTGSVKTCFVKTTSDIPPQVLKRLSGMLNNLISGLPAEQISKSVIMLLEKTLEENFPDAVCLVRALDALIEEMKSYDLTICGSSNPLSFPEFSNIEVAKEYINMLSKYDLIKETLLEKEYEPGEFYVRMGDENKFFQNPCACLVSVCCYAKIPVTFGIMGPTRMNYSRLKAGCDEVMEQLKNIINEEY